MSKQAKFLIDDAKYHIAGIATSWDYDNRVSTSTTDAFPGVLCDNASGYGVRVSRAFQPQTAGNLTLEMFWKTELTSEGVRVRMLSSDGAALFTLTTRDGVFHMNGAPTGLPAPLGDTRIRLNLDLEAHTARFAANGHDGGVYALHETADAARLELGTDGTTEIRLTPVKNQLTVDYLALQTFIGTSEAFPEEWQLDGAFSIRSHNAANPQMDYTYAVCSGAQGKISAATLPLARTHSGDVICEGYFLLADGDDGARFSLCGGKDELCGVYTKGGAFYAADGRLLRRFTANVWQLIRFETAGDTVRIKIDGKDCGVCALPAGRVFDSVRVSFAPEKQAELCFADILCEERIDYPDYCPEPHAVRPKDMEIGVNVCNMWREGHHFGWDRITYFEDNTPLIGPYDEGLPEVADWEIKFMTEHGITFQHFCWYCPDPLINAPIKRSRMDAALRDGFMNARYSDKMKFIIMWENNTYRNTNPEDFKNYIWKYWCEYFFTDPRYLKIDNRPLLSLWSFNFVNHWGGAEKAKEIIAFMNEDIKNYGCDGIYLMATAGSADAARYGALSEYCDVTYAYHFGTDGYSPEHQIASIDALNERRADGMAPFVQTVSVGFNACPWHGASARKPLISLDDYETVLRHAKAHIDASDGTNPFDKIAMMSTWNEYGEGTYIMPAGIHGFGYLDKIREVFVPESGKCENCLPDENQQKRISYLRVPGRCVIRRLGFEPSEENKLPNKVVRTLTFGENGSATGVWRAFNSAVELRPNRDAVEICPVGSHEHYSLVGSAETGLCAASEATHIRLRVRSKGAPSRIRLAFLTDTDKRWAGNKCESTYPIPASEEFTELMLCPGRFPTWQGKITDIRIDNMSRQAFEVASLDFMVYEDAEQRDPAVYVNGELFKTEFQPILTEDGEYLVSLDPGRCGFRAFGLFQTYDRASQTVFVASQTVEARFVLGSETALVGGALRALKHPVTMRDGLPTFGMKEFCGIFGFRYAERGRHLFIQV